MKPKSAAERFRWLNRIETFIDAARIVSLLVFVYSFGVLCGVALTLVAEHR